MSDLTSGHKPIAEYLVPGRHAHLVGIGGVSMSALGQVLQGMGMVITGSDQQRSAATDKLEAGGIPVAIGHRPEQIEGADLVIRTAAAQADVEAAFGSVQALAANGYLLQKPMSKKAIEAAGLELLAVRPVFQ